jgi:phosphoribosylformylglycinamidine (FGAM) synthase-like enzyme
MGLAFDDWDLDYYTAMFKDELKRDPTNVELFDIAQSNSEHSRWAATGCEDSGCVSVGMLQAAMQQSRNASCVPGCVGQ